MERRGRRKRRRRFIHLERGERGKDTGSSLLPFLPLPPPISSHPSSVFSFPLCFSARNTTQLPARMARRSPPPPLVLSIITVSPAYRSVQVIVRDPLSPILDPFFPGLPRNEALCTHDPRIQFTFPASAPPNGAEEICRR